MGGAEFRRRESTEYPGAPIDSTPATSNMNAFSARDRREKPAQKRTLGARPGVASYLRGGASELSGLLGGEGNSYMTALGVVLFALWCFSDSPMMASGNVLLFGQSHECIQYSDPEYSMMAIMWHALGAYVLGNAAYSMAMKK